MNRKIIIGTLIMFIITSCGSRRNFAYFRDLMEGESYPIPKKKEFSIKPDDRLNITVRSKEPALAEIFNSNISTNLSKDSESSSQSTSGLGYKVDYNGNIDFPLLGTLHVAGMTLKDVSGLIKRKIENEGYIKNPMVIVDIVNFEYTILGALGSGVFRADDGDVTLIEAIAKAGDIKAIGKLDRIAVIREIDGCKQIFYHDIRSKEILSSPCYYLQQNDIIYVEPKYRDQSKTERGMSVTAYLVSFATSIITAIALITK